MLFSEVVARSACVYSLEREAWSRTSHWRRVARKTKNSGRTVRLNSTVLLLWAQLSSNKVRELVARTEQGRLSVKLRWKHAECVCLKMPCGVPCFRASWWAVNEYGGTHAPFHCSARECTFKHRETLIMSVRCYRDNFRLHTYMLMALLIVVSVTAWHYFLAPIFCPSSPLKRVAMLNCVRAEAEYRSAVQLTHTVQSSG